VTPAAVGRGVIGAAVAARMDIIARWRSLARAERITTVLVTIMVFAGVVMRIQGIGFPPSFTFDEQFYAPTSHHFLIGVPDRHDYHPPLGKLFGTVGLLLFGFNSVGWRFMYLCFGLQTMVVGFWLAREIFADRRAGWFAAAFMAADGFFIAYSRAGLIDGMLTCLVLWSMLAIVTARSWRGVLCAAILVGAAASVKWSGAMTIIPVTAALLLLRRVRWYTMFWFAVTPVVHLAIWWAGLRLMGHPSDPLSVWNVLTNSFVSLAGTAPFGNPLASAWYTWPVLYHPIVVKLAAHGPNNVYASSAGNPVFWFPASLLVIGLPLARGVTAVRAGWRRRWSDLLSRDFTNAAMLLAIGWIGLLFMWSVTLGKHMFFYHYMPSYGFAIVLLAGCAAKLERRWPWLVMGFFALAILMAIWLAPVWCEIPLPERVANWRLIFVPWRP
jgi:dolichyl-phosphate-mannose-protein mannosyltransferase